MRALTFRDRMREEAAKSAAAESADPWRLTLERVRGKVDFFDGLGAHQLSDTLGFARSPATQSDCRHVSATGKSDGRAWLDGSAGAGSDAGRIPGTNKRILPPTAQHASRPLKSPVLTAASSPRQFRCYPQTRHVPDVAKATRMTHCARCAVSVAGLDQRNTKQIY